METVADYYHQLLKLLSQKKPVEMIFHDDLVFDLSFLQLLYSFQKSADKNSLEISFQGVKAMTRMVKMREFAGLPPLPFEKEKN